LFTVNFIDSSSRHKRGARFIGSSGIMNFRCISFTLRVRFCRNSKTVMSGLYSPKVNLKKKNSFEPLRYLIFKVQSPLSFRASLFIIHRRSLFVNTFLKLFLSFFIIVQTN